MLELITDYPGETLAYIDEVGRGCFFGPVYCTAIILDNSKLEEPTFNNVKDSKKISKKKRKIVCEFLKDNLLEYKNGVATAKEIDKINIRRATFLAMHRALDDLETHFDRIIVDGNAFEPYYSVKRGEYIPHTCIIGGDNKYVGIASASIIAKEARDEYIKLLVEENLEVYEKYDLTNNMGYGTKKHIDAIKKNGITELHRKTFGICSNY